MMAFFMHGVKAPLSYSFEWYPKMFWDDYHKIIKKQLSDDIVPSDDSP
jgi:hypothetical protein